MTDGLTALADLVTADDTLTRWPGARLRLAPTIARRFRPLVTLSRMCDLPVVVDETFTAGLWRLERDGMTLRAGVVRAEP